AVIGQYLHDFAHESQRVFQIIEHRKRSDNSSLSSPEHFPDLAGRKEIRDEKNVRRVIAAKLSTGWINPNQRVTAPRIGLQCRAVVATDIENQGVIRQPGIRKNLLHLPMQMTHHAWIDSGAI